MSEEDLSEEIHVASEDSPVLTTYEPDFQRVFARGTLLRVEETDEETVQLAFWSTKDTEIEIEDEDISDAVGYRLETEVMMHWNSVMKLRSLLDSFIEDNAPERFQEELD